MKNFNYCQAVRYLDKCLIFGIKPSLVRIRKLLELLGNPHKKLDFIHVVGTNGKTSTSIMTANILDSNGIRCGFHISPHIDDYTERIWFCGKYISRKRFAALLNDIFPFIEKVNSLDLGGPMTQFELVAAMAFELARQEELQAMVLEAGMGGRWDATNIADSKVVGLTNVSLEHTDILGKSIKEIATEKVQVIKKGAMVATLSENKTVLDTLKKHIEKIGANLFLYKNDFILLKKQKRYLEGWILDIKGINKEYSDIKIPLLGNYQPHNLSLALVLSELYLSILNRDIDEKKLKVCFKNLKIKGRFELLQKDPVVIADTSHNPAGIDNFVKNINDNFNDKKKIIIFSVLRDKDYKTMVHTILPIADKIILTSSNTPRSLDIKELEKLVLKEINILKNTGSHIPDEIYNIDSITNSLNYALKISESSDIICITGSITNLADLIRKK